MADRSANPSLRRQLYDILEQSRHGDRLSRLVEAFILTLILVNIAAVILESVPDIDRRFHRWFVAIEIVSLAAFTVEFALRRVCRRWGRPDGRCRLPTRPPPPAVPRSWPHAARLHA